MALSRRQAYWGEVVGLGIASLVMLRLGLLALFFLLPLQLVWIRRGERGGIESSLVFLGSALLLRLFETLRAPTVSGGDVFTVTVLVLVVPLVMAIGLFMLNSQRVVFSGRDGSISERLLLFVAAALIVLVPSVAAVVASPVGEALADLWTAQLQPLLSQVEASEAEIAALQRQVATLAGSALLPFVLLWLLGNWWGGALIAFRTRFPLTDGNAVMARLAGHDFAKFTVPVWTVWLFIASWSGVALSEYVGFGIVGLLFWNVALSVTILYGLQGAAVARHLLLRWNANARILPLIVLALVVAMFLRGILLVVGIGIPVLGLSEIWISYHRFDGSEDKDEGNSQ
jgi:hypothetical protein